VKKSEPKPINYGLRQFMSMVKVSSLAMGDMLVDVRWRKNFRKPGVLTRLAAAQRLTKFINDHLRKP